MSNIYKLVFLFLLFSANAFAINCEHAITTPDINECAKAQQDKVEVELNSTYKKVLKKITDSEADNPAKTKQALIEAQRAWIKFREFDCDAIYIQYEGGTIRTLMYISCMQNHAEQRIKELNDFVPNY